jgi:hypothetical protein
MVEEFQATIQLAEETPHEGERDTYIRTLRCHRLITTAVTCMAEEFLSHDPTCGENAPQVKGTLDDT